MRLTGALSSGAEDGEPCGIFSGVLRLCVCERERGSERERESERQRERERERERDRERVREGEGARCRGGGSPLSSTTNASVARAQKRGEG